MTVHEGADLHNRVERYEAAVHELRASHQDIKDVLTDQVLFERWQQLGAARGFTAGHRPAPREHTAVNPPPAMSGRRA